MHRSSNASRMPSARGRTLIGYVHGTRAGTTHTPSGGPGHSSHSNGVPGCPAGTAIRIRTGSGKPVASGTFHRMGTM